MRALAFWIKLSKEISIATWFCMRDIFGQVALCPVSRHPSIYSVVGLLKTLGKSAYDMAGKMLMSPEYR